MADPAPDTRVVLVYGSFRDPDTGRNFLLLRIPAPRAPWARRIAPAIDRLVRSLFSETERARDRALRRAGREPLIHWSVEGGEADLWTLRQDVSRYAWTGAVLERLPRQAAHDPGPERA